nr:hypothetical protein B0A51_03280 [Rachicladosporium sp. CCFEE 5018]
MHFRKAAIMNPTMATALSPTRLHAFRFKNGAENTRSRRDPGPVEGILHSKGCRSARAVSEAARHLHRARLIFNVRKGITADEADNKLNLKSPGRVEYFPMVFEKGQWALYMSPGDGYLYHARKPGRKVKVSQPSPLRECMTLGDGQDEIDTMETRLPSIRKSALNRLRSQAAIEDTFARVVNTKSREPGNCQAAEKRKDATKR